MLTFGPSAGTLCLMRPTPPTLERIASSRRALGRSDGIVERHAVRERELSDLASQQHGVVAAPQLLGLGYSRQEIAGRVRQGRLTPVHAGIYAVGHRALSRDGRWMAAVLAGGGDALLSHRDAVALWEVGDFTGPRIEITVPGLGSRHRSGIRFHRTRRLSEIERATVRSIPVTSVERTIIDVAASLPPRRVREIYLEAERRRLLDLELLSHLAHQSVFRRGVGSVRRLLREDTRTLARTRSALEVQFLDFCREEGMPEPEVNVWLHGYLVDAYWPQAGLVVELDGYEYHRGRGAFERDRERIGDLRLAGITVIPITHRRLTRQRRRVAEILHKATRAAPGLAAAEADIAS